MVLSSEECGQSRCHSVPPTWSAPFFSPAAAADAAAVTEVVRALESSLYGESRFSQADLEDEWSELHLERDVRVVRDGTASGYGWVCERGESWTSRALATRRARARDREADGDRARGEAARGGAGRIQNDVFEADSAARKLLESLGYRAVHFELELRIELNAPPPPPEWPEGLQVSRSTRSVTRSSSTPRSRRRSRRTWDFTPRDFEWWSKRHLRSGASTDALVRRPRRR